MGACMMSDRLDRRVLDAAREAMWCLREECAAAGQNEVRQHATLAKHARVAERLAKALAAYDAERVQCAK